MFGFTSLILVLSITPPTLVYAHPGRVYAHSNGKLGLQLRELHMAGDDDEKSSNSTGVKILKWGGEKNGFLLWQKLIQNRAVMKGGLIKKIVIDELSLEDHVAGGGDEDKYLYADAWVYELVGAPLLEKLESTACAMFAGFPAGQGGKVLHDFQNYFAGDDDEDAEDLQDEWKQVSFQTDGVTSLATFMAKMNDYVQRINNCEGVVITPCQALKRVLKQLPEAYAIIRQSLSTHLLTLKKREKALDPTDMAARKIIESGLEDLLSRLRKFNRDENLENATAVKSLLNFSVVGEGLNSLNRDDRAKKVKCYKCLQPVWPLGD